MESGETTVLVADDQAMIRAGLVALLSAEPDLRVLAEAEDGEGAVAAVRRRHPDVVLMDVRMPGMDGISAAREIISCTEGATAVIMLTVHDLDERLERYDADRDAALERQGPQHVVATSPAQLDARYRGGNHPVSLDLRGLHLDEEQTTSVRTDSGPIQVLLPAGLPADVRCSSEHGPVRCLGAEVTGGEVTVTDQ